MAKCLLNCIPDEEKHRFKYKTMRYHTVLQFVHLLSNNTEYSKYRKLGLLGIRVESWDNL